MPTPPSPLDPATVEACAREADDFETQHPCLGNDARIVAARIRALATRPPEPTPPADTDRIYPCDDCGMMRTKAEGGTTFTVCDACWDKHHGKAEPTPPGGLRPAREVAHDVQDKWLSMRGSHNDLLVLIADAIDRDRATRLDLEGAHTLRKEVRDIIAGHGAGYDHDIDKRTAEAMEAFDAWLRRRLSRGTPAPGTEPLRRAFDAIERVARKAIETGDRLSRRTPK